MKIAFLADAPYPHTRRWIEHFVRRGDECEVISFRPATIDGARVRHVAGGEPLGKARYLLHARRIGAMIEKIAPDLVHALHLTSYGFLGALSGVRPLVVSVWGTDVLQAPRLTPFHAWLTRYALAGADAITATGLHLATETTRYAPRGTPVTVVPYGVDLTRFAPGPQEPKGGAVVVGTAARLSPEKGLKYLLDAFARLRQRHGEGVRLRIAGEGPERRALERQIRRLGLESAVELAGWVEPEAMAAFLGELDVFVLPSLFEGFGVAAVEASAAGLPLVASAVHGLPDVVRDGETGLLVPPKDAAALAEAIDALIADPARRAALGRSGRAFVAGRYDWAANARQMELVYESVTSGQRRKVAATWS